MTNIICKIFGHKVDNMHNDSGYGLCLRCTEHEYYDDWTNKDRLGMLYYPIWRLKKRIEHKIYNWKCKRSGLPF